MASLHLSPAPPSPPPPPPPPPPLASPSCEEQKMTTSKITGGTIINNVIPDYTQIGLNALQICKECSHKQKDKSSHGDGHDNLIYLSFYRPVVPIIQSGPVCGLVALAMASSLAGTEITTQQLLSLARKNGYSMQGEMFSVDFMYELTRSVISADRTVSIVQIDSKMQLVSRLLREDIFLVPYDADKNHSPCLRRGHNAHWAVVTGFMLAVDVSDKDKDQIALMMNCQEDFVSEHRLYHLHHLQENLFELIQDVIMRSKLHNVVVYAHQGKSKHVGIWPLQDLLDSNANLLELDPRRASDGKDYVLPEGGVHMGLCKRIVIISKTIQSK